MVIPNQKSSDDPMLCSDVVKVGPSCTILLNMKEPINLQEETFALRNKYYISGRNRFLFLL